MNSGETSISATAWRIYAADLRLVLGFGVYGIATLLAVKFLHRFGAPAFLPVLFSAASWLLLLWLLPRSWFFLAPVSLRARDEGVLALCWRSSKGYVVPMLVVLFLLIGLALVLLAGNIPVLRGRFLSLLATPTPTSQTTYFSQVVINNGAIFIHRSASPSASTFGLGPMPQRCPRVSTLLYFTTPLDPPGLGAGPVWLSGFTGPTAALDHLAPLTASRAGWYETLAVFIQKGFTGTIALTGTNQQNNQPILLGKTDPRSLVSTLTLHLDSGDHFIADGAWEMTSVTLAIPTAGCYRLHASWGESAWDRYFAAGA